MFPPFFHFRTGKETNLGEQIQKKKIKGPVRYFLTVGYQNKRKKS